MRRRQKSSVEAEEAEDEGEDEDEDEDEDSEEEGNERAMLEGHCQMVSNKQTPVVKSQTLSLQTSFGTAAALISRLSKEKEKEKKKEKKKRSTKTQSRQRERRWRMPLNGSNSECW